MVKLGKSVTGISHIDYIFPIAAYAYLLKKDSITRREILHIVREEAVKREREKALYLGKFWQDYEKKLARKKSFLEGITGSLILAMRKWGLIEKIDRNESFKVLPILYKIGELYTAKRTKLAKIRLLDSILNSKKENPFEPFNFLMKIRNNVVDRIEVVVKRGKNDRLIETFTVSELEGRAYNDHLFVYKKLGTNFRSFDIMVDWGIFFELLYTYNKTPLSKIDIEGTILYPKYEVFLTKVLCTLNEMVMFFDFIKNKGQGLEIEDFRDRFPYNKYVIVSILHNLKALDIIHYHKGKIEIPDSLRSIANSEKLGKIILRKIASKEGLLLIDSPNEKGVYLQAITDFAPEYTIVAMDPQWKLSDFEKALRASYSRLTGGLSYRYMWIAKIKEEVCRELRIHGSTFDSYLCKLAEERPGLIEFSKAAGDVTRRTLTKFDKPFKFKGNIYRMMRIEG